jgi:hypothetical protein
MKKVIFTTIFACIALSSVEVSAQTSKGDVWLGGSSNLGLTLTPDFSLSTSFTADYFLKDRLSLGAQVYVGISSETYVGLSPRVQYFITESIYANLDANVLQVNPGGTSVDLHSLNAGVGYWYSLSENVVVSPMLQLNDLSGDLGIGTVVSFQVKL